MNNEVTNLPELPEGWMYTRLSEIAEINPTFIHEHLAEDLEVTFLPMKCVEELTGKIDLSLTRRLSDVKRGYRPFVIGDLLFAKITPCMENGKVAVAYGLRNGIGFGSTEFHVIRLPESFPRKFIFYFLIREELRKDAQRNMTGSAGQLRVPVGYIQKIHIPVPPLPEQHRIVAKIEELFTKLDAGVEALKKVKAQLKRYRQSVLKHAFEGKLTAEWRQAHQHEIEPASVLLDRIKQERQKSPKGRHKELPPLDTSNLPELPEGWTWARVADIGEVVTGTTPSKAKLEYYGRDFCFYKPADLNNGYYVRESQDGLSSKGIVKSRILPPKTTLVTCIGATIGKTGFIRKEGASNQQINAIIPENQLLPELIYFICISPQFQKAILDNASSTTLPILNKRRFELLSLPLMSILEQHRIVEEIERRFSIADEIEKIVDHSFKQAEKLRQSILKKAFEGKLVPQDPNDEPAEKLLERIKAERARQLAETKSARKRNKTHTQMRWV
ncbi:MAG: restriction endonuclease subunit S [Candidatus Methanosuratincola sp.]